MKPFARTSVARLFCVLTVMVWLVAGARSRAALLAYDGFD